MNGRHLFKLNLLSEYLVTELAHMCLDSSTTHLPEMKSLHATKRTTRLKLVIFVYNIISDTTTGKT